MADFIKNKIIDIIGNLDVGQRLRKYYVFSALNKLSPKGKYVLDAGSGAGDYILPLACKYPESRFMGVELDARKVEKCDQEKKQLHMANITFRQGDISNGINDEFDIIYCIDVLEHINDDRAVLNNFFRILNPHGKLILHLPNLRQKRYFRKFKNWHQDDHVRDGYGKEETCNKLSDLGYRDIEVKFTYGWAGALAWEIQKLCESWFSHRLGQVISLPVTIILTYLDYKLPKKAGNGMLMIAGK